MGNKYINDTAIYKKDTDPMVRMKVLRNLIEGLYIMAHYFEPICPNVANQIFQSLTVPPIKISQLSWGTEELNGVVFTEAKPLLYTKQ